MAWYDPRDWDPIDWAGDFVSNVHGRALADLISNIGPEGSRLNTIAGYAGGAVHDITELGSKLSPFSAPFRVAEWAAEDVKPWLMEDLNAVQFGPTAPEPFGPDGMGFSPGLVQSQIESGMEWNPEQNRWVPMLTQDMLSTGIPSPPNLGDAARTAGQHQGLSALSTALPSNLEALYEQLYGGMRSDAEAAWQRSTEGNAELDAARDAYLATLGGGPNLAYWDNRLSRTLAYLDQTEKDLLAGIDEMEALKRAGIEGAAERQMEMYAELERVRSERLRVDEEQSLLRLSQMEAERVATEQVWHQSISERGAQRQAEHAQRQAEAAARLEGMGIDSSAMTTDETAALLEMQAERGDLFSGRIEAAGAGRAGYQELALQDMFGAANRSLEDQLFAGRAATGETEAMSLQALAEAVLEMQQNVASTAAEGRFVASEEAEAGKFAERGSAAQRASEAAAARLGFAESDAARESAADEAYYGALSQIDQAELMSEIGLENQRLEDTDATTLANALSAAMGVAFGGDEASAMAAAILAEAGLGSFGLDMLNRSQDLSDKQFAYDESMAVAESLLGPMQERMGVELTVDRAAAILRNDWATGFENQQGVQLSDLLEAGLSGEEIIDYYTDNPSLSGLPPNWLLEMLAADIATAGG